MRFHINTVTLARTSPRLLLNVSSRCAGVVQRVQVVLRLFREAYGPSSGEFQVEYLTSQVDELNSDMRQCDPHNNEKEYIAVQAAMSNPVSVINLATVKLLINAPCVY